ncbi:ribosomal-protein-alanine N-acetyltransferase [Arsenicitalea aurantiaca]|uniref:Ribosomal-protein-alanine N-acetyltransferase n=1 Tax=Arsenicitalea aurantiaca TaxID=1783274 RepID=A0A433X7X9_9HYPH|nr:ribosomal protein S18-alanine N-acetyltransferase [Arsenicitalea aurantiaca]RUT30197.1 ribosomal-protein-alanine N-acetyltransferase [Arsenicitalea aurantiaca]
MTGFWSAPHGLGITRGETGDAEALARLHANSFYRGWPREDFETYILDRRSPVLVARDARRRVAGFIMLRLAGDEAELITIAVDPRWRGKGVGAALLRAGLSFLSMTAARKLFLEVAEDNPAAIALYRRAGFVEIGRRSGYYARADGRPATALVLSRDIG